ncbi:MAG TPA: hypothetical protein VNA26_01270 [Chitinophagaceae bacterium]|nr:hypothetical protein [Chitinophagaceae bacterium]
MERKTDDPANEQQKSYKYYPAVDPDVTPRREGGEDSIAESSPIDARADEKVIVNYRKENKSINDIHTREAEENY